MVDKIWYEWQQNPRNKHAFGGGSVAPLANYTIFSEFPTGLPPYLGVSVRSDPKHACDNDLGSIPSV